MSIEHLSPGKKAILFLHITREEKEEEYQPLKLVMKHPWVWSVSNFAFLASVHEGEWSVPSRTIPSSHRKGMVTYLKGMVITAELGQVEQESQAKFPNWHGFEPTITRLTIQLTTTLPSTYIYAHYICICTWNKDVNTETTHEYIKGRWCSQFNCFLEECTKPYSPSTFMWSSICGNQ